MHNIDALLEFVQSHPRLFVLTGAGVSTESGIPDYRDTNGDWKRSQPVTYQAFMGEAATRQRYWARSMIGWRTLGHARPGAAHHALAQLQAAGRVELLLTQNVDGLHQAAGSPRVVDLHGRIDAVRCMHCEQRSPRAALQARLLDMNPAWAALHAEQAPDGDADLEGHDFSRLQVPACEACGGLLKPDVVFFGESVPRERVQAGMDAVRACDAMLVAGTSLMVYSGFRFVQAAVAAGRPVAAVNLGRTRADELLCLKVAGPVGETLGALLRRMQAGVAI
jgi:NAD-dependent SIR2 family protein deacetylase